MDGEQIATKGFLMDSSLYGLYEHLYMESPKIRAREKCQNQPTPTHPDQPNRQIAKIFNFCVFHPIWMKFGMGANIGQKTT